MRSNTIRRVLVGLSLAGMAATCGAAEPLNVLFIGNSFTHGGDIPNVVADLAASAGWDRPNVTSAAVSGQTLTWHLGGTSSNTPSIIAQGGWDYVVLQDYSTRPTDAPGLANANPLEFKRSATGLYDLVKASSPDAQVVLYQTWARHENHAFYGTYFDDRDQMQSQLNYHYRDAAENYIPAHATSPDPDDVFVAPVGEAWGLNYHRNNVMLHGGDLYHAGVRGQYLNGLVLYGMIYDRLTTGLSPLPGVNQETASYLQGLADETTGRVRWGGPEIDRPRGVHNGSFESPLLAIDGRGDDRVVELWAVVGDFTNGAVVRNGTDASFPGTSAVGGVDRPLPGSADGTQYLNLTRGVVSQALADELEPNTTYTLEIALGQRLEGSPVFFDIELFGGPELLDSFHGYSGDLPAGTFEDLTLSYTTGDDVGAFRNLKIVLSVDSAVRESSLAIDNLRLTVVPEPATLAIFGLGAAALRRRR